MQGLIKLREESHNRMLRYRSIDYIVLTSVFSDLWKEASDEDKKIIELLVRNGDKKAVLQYIKNNPSRDLSELTWRELTEKARIYQIPNYSRLSRNDLMIKIASQENKNEKGRDAKNDEDART